MSMIRCESCERLIDSDDDPGCFCEPPEDLPLTTAQRINLTEVLCESCRGTGLVWMMPDGHEIECPQCNGAGEEGICADCGINRADPPSPLCPGCEAYQGHTK